MKPKKCEFACRRLLFLGHVISSNGISMQEDKMKAIQDVPFPSTVKKLQRFLGMAGYYRKFIPNYGKITTSLYDLTKDDKTRFHKITPNDKALESFELVKTAIAKDVLLCYPDFQAARDNPKRRFTILTDASHTGFGAVLCQNDTELRLRPLYFASRRTKPAETRYSATEIEGKGLHYACMKFYQFIVGHPTNVLTDHHALVFMYNSNTLLGNVRIERWMIDLKSRFDLHVAYKAGRFNLVADFLSRSLSPISISAILTTDLPAITDTAITNSIHSQRSSFLPTISALITRRQAKQYGHQPNNTNCGCDLCSPSNTQ
ncbi:MAG TPA: ribonuclease H family protein, partial [Puia sp.]|nr:ribonuclease H family protein [Puia sp.]